MHETNVDRGEIERFTAAVFRHADTGYVKLRAFGADRPFASRQWLAVPASDRAAIVDAAVRLAAEAARAAEPVVFCPPIATFRDRDGGAREGNIACGVVLSVECDERPVEARRAIERLLGIATIVVASGGEWTDPETGEVEDKLHLHWRLSAPTRTAEEHEKLKKARRLAQKIAGSDASAVPICHPMRWPGSLHRKDITRPRLARIAGGDPDREINLDTMLASLCAECDDDIRGSSTTRPAQGLLAPSGGDVEATLRVIPNPDLDWEDWSRIGMATYAATGGSDDGRRLFERWSAKSSKNDCDRTRQRWDGYHRWPPTRIGWGTLAFLADPHWIKAIYLANKNNHEALIEFVQGRQAEAARLGEAVEAIEASTMEIDDAPSPGSVSSLEQPTAAPFVVEGLPASPRSTAPSPAASAKPATAISKPQPRAYEFVDILADADLAPPFPTALLPQPFRAFVEDVADRMQVPADFVAVPTLVAAATMVGREFRLAPKLHDDWEERACLWGAVIAPPSARKSPPMDAAMRPITKMQGEMHRDWRQAHDEWRRHKAAKDVENLGPEPVMETVYTADTTVEGLVPLMSEEGNADPRGIVLYRDELSGWFGSFNKYRQRGGDDRPFYLQCWSGGVYRIDRRSTGTLFVSDLYLNVVGSIQPEVLQEVLRGGDRDGMTARLQLLVWPRLPERVDVVDRRPDLDAMRAVEERMRAIRGATALDGGKVLRFSGDAYAIFNAWLLNNQNRPEIRAADAFSAHLAKYPGLFARLALTLHFMEHGGSAPTAGGAGPGQVAKVSAKIADAVREITDKYLEPHARRVYGYLSAHPARAGAVRIARWVREKRIEEFTVRDISRNSWREFNAAADDRPLIEAAMRYLEANDWVQLVDKRSGPRGGRPTFEALVNPKVYE